MIRLIELNPKDAIAYYNRGLLEANKRDFDRAIADFNRAIQLSSLRVPPHQMWKRIELGIVRHDITRG